MSNKIPCGGFYLDDTLNVNDSGELSIKGGTPYQYLVTDGSGNTKWEDRLAYVATEEQAIFSQENIAFTEYSGLYASHIMPITAISSGEKVRVDFDGETYDCIVSVPIEATIFIGNLSLFKLGDDTGEPFVIDYNPEFTTIAITTSLTNPTHTVSITRIAETVHKIQQKFLPDQLVFYYDENGRLVDAEGVEMTPEQAKAVGLNFIIQSDSSVARPISALYDDTGVSFYVAKVVNASIGRFELDKVRVGIPLPA